MSAAVSSELRVWAEAMLPTGMTQARMVLELLDDLDRQRLLVLSLAERIAAASEVLSVLAEKKKPRQNAGAGGTTG